MPGAVRLLPLLLATSASLALGACGGGDGSALSGATATRPSATATRPAVTATRPERTQPTVTATAPEPTTPETTEEVETDEAETEAAPPPVTLTQTTITPTIAPTVTLTATETQESETVLQTVSVAATSSSDDTPWPWIVLGALVLAAVVIGIFALRSRRAAAAELERRADDLARRSLTTLDDVRLQGSIVTGRVQALAAEARSLERKSDDEATRRRVGALGGALDALGSALETDRNLRLASPPPTEAQLNYSTSLIRRHVDEVDAMLRPPPGPSASPVS
jgi:hypothetical protein